MLEALIMGSESKRNAKQAVEQVDNYLQSLSSIKEITVNENFKQI